MSDNKLMAKIAISAMAALSIVGAVTKFESSEDKLKKEQEKTKQLEIQFKIDSLAAVKEVKSNKP